MNYTWLPFETMVDVMDFALDNAYVKMPDGTLYQCVTLYHQG